MPIFLVIEDKKKDTDKTACLQSNQLSLVIENKQKTQTKLHVYNPVGRWAEVSKNDKYCVNIESYMNHR